MKIDLKAPLQLVQPKTSGGVGLPSHDSVARCVISVIFLLLMMICFSLLWLLVVLVDVGFCPWWLRIVLSFCHG